MVTGTSKHASSYVNNKGKQAHSVAFADYKDVLPSAGARWQQAVLKQRVV